MFKGLGEFAGQCTTPKMYTDKLKLALIAKLHLNFFTKKTGKDDIFVPFLLIMGFECQLLMLRLAQPKLYYLEEVGRSSFPVSKKKIDEGVIEEMVNLLTFTRDRALHLRQQMLDSRLSPVVVNIDWCTDVVWPSGKKVPAVVVEEDEEDEEDEDEEEAWS